MGKGIFSIFSGGKVKNESKLMFNLCCKRAASIGHTEFLRTNGKMSLEAVYKTDMLNFLVYLMYADGCLCKEEIKFVNSLFGINWIDKQYSEYANKWDLKTEHLRDRPPMSLEAFVRSNVGGETGEISDEYYLDNNIHYRLITIISNYETDNKAVNIKFIYGRTSLLDKIIKIIKGGNI